MLFAGEKVSSVFLEQAFDAKSETLSMEPTLRLFDSYENLKSRVETPLSTEPASARPEREPCLNDLSNLRRAFARPETNTRRTWFRLPIHGLNSYRKMLLAVTTVLNSLLQECQSCENGIDLHFDHDHTICEI